MAEKDWHCENILLNKYKIQELLPKTSERGNSYQIIHIEWDMPLRLKKVQATEDCLKNYWQHVWKLWIGLPGHQNIVNAYHFFTIDENLCLLTEYIQGKNLREYLKEDAQNLSQIFPFAIDLAIALQYSHQYQLSHGKLEDNNLFIRNGTLCLGDFYGVSYELEFEKRVEEDKANYVNFLNRLFLEFSVEQKSWELPENFHHYIQNLESKNLDFSKLIYDLRKFYREISEKNLFRFCTSRWLSENVCKHSFSYMEQGIEKHAERLWTFAGQAQPASLNALWNWHLFYLRQAMIPLHSFVKNIEKYQDMAPSQIICAQGKLALETGTKILDTLDKVQDYISSVKSDNDLLRVEGELLYRICRYEEAVIRFQKLIEQNASESDDWYRITVSCFAAGKIEEAEKFCEKGLKNHPHHILLQVVQACIFYTTGKMELAEKQFQKMLELYPDSLWFLVHAAEFYAGIGLYEKQPNPRKDLAKQCYEKVLRLHPNSIRAIKGYKKCGGEKIPQAKDFLMNLEVWSEIKNFTGHMNMVTTSVITPDGQSLVTGDCDGNIYLWDIETSICKGQFSGHRKHITDIKISANGNFLISGSWDNTARIWDMKTQVCSWVIDKHNDKVCSVGISEDAHFAITGCWDGLARVWDVENQQEISRRQVENSWITCVNIAPDASYALCCDEDERMGLWQIDSDEDFPIMKGSGAILSDDGKTGISSRYGALEIWELPSCKSIKTISTDRRNDCLGLTQDNRFILLRNQDDILSVWDLEEEHCIVSLHADNSLCGAIAKNGNYLISVDGEVIYLWENIMHRPFPLLRRAAYLGTDLRNMPQTPKLIQKMAWEAESFFSNREYAQAIEQYKRIQKIPGYESTPELRDQIYKSYELGNFKQLNLKKLRLWKEFPVRSAITSMAFCNVAKSLLLSSSDDPIRICNFMSGYRLNMLEGHSGFISKVVVARDSNRALTASWDGSVQFWNLDYPTSNKLLGKKSSWATAIALDEKAARALCGWRSGEVILYDLIEEKETPLCKRESSVTHIVFRNPYTITCFKDGTILVWDISNWKCIREFRPHKRHITAIDIREKEAISGTLSGEILHYSLETGEIFEQWKQAEIVRGLRIIQKNSFFTLSHNSILKLWNKSSSEHRFSFTLDEYDLTSWSISKNNRYFMSGHEDKQVKLWELDWNWSSE